MGDKIVGTLPKTARWKSVIDLLDDSPQLTGSLAAAITDAADYRLKQLKSDEAVAYAFWLLTRIASASRGGDFSEELTKLGLNAAAGTSMLAFVSDLSDKVRQRTSAQIAAGDFAEISSQAVRAALLETVALQGHSLFGTRLEDLQGALRSYSAPDRFSLVAERFFAAFFTRTLRSALDRQIAQHIGPGNRISSIAESNEFGEQLDRYTRQSARVTRVFASEWYSLRNWKSGHRISHDEARGFVAHALDKLRGAFTEGRLA
ncbi:MAG: hypothetical protein GEU75_11965 [Dehalococcoidia bacterium]|nr:hypothetical protein [Dehalococcoidia bacterium]